MVKEDLKPCDIMTRQAFENAIVVNAAIGGSTNAPIHLNAVTAHMGVELENDDWQKVGYDIPLLCNVQPAGEYLSEDFYMAGSLPAVISELKRSNVLLQLDATMVTGKTMEHHYSDNEIKNADVIYHFNNPLKPKAGFINLKGNLFDSAIIKTSVISDTFSKRYLSNPDDPEAFEGRAIVFDGPEDYHARIEDPSLEIDENCVLIMRGTGPIGYPGAAEAVNMQPSGLLIQKGIDELPCVGDGRQSGTSASPSILKASPEAAVGGGLALLQTGDRVRIDLKKGSADILIDEEELEKRRQSLANDNGYPYPESQTPWQEIQRDIVGQLDKGMVLKPAIKYRRIAQTKGIPRDNH